MMKHRIYIFHAVILALSFLGPIMPLDDSHLLHAPLYHFFHANVIHAAVNLYVFHQVVRYLHPSIRQMATAFAIATFIPPILLSTPIIGLSAFIYSLFGLALPIIQQKRKYVLYIVFFIFLQAFLPAIAWHIHLYTFTLSALLVIHDR